MIFVIRLGRERNFQYICGGKAATVSLAEETRMNNKTRT